MGLGEAQTITAVVEEVDLLVKGETQITIHMVMACIKAAAAALVVQVHPIR